MHHDHYGTGQLAPRMHSCGEQKQNTLLQNLDCDGYAKVDRWGLPPSLVDELAKEVNEKLDLIVARRRAGRSQLSTAVISTSWAKLATLEADKGRLFLHNSSLLRTAVGYLGLDAELTGYSALRLSNSLKSNSQYLSGKWHHDRCGARLKAFLFLHDVTSTGSRPTQVARGSHSTLFWSYHDLEESRFSDRWVEENYELVSMDGVKGGGFVFDTNSLHRGVVEGDSPRTVLILEFNNARKSGDLSRVGTAFRSKLGFPCPSNGQRSLRRSARQLLS